MKGCCASATNCGPNGVGFDTSVVGTPRACWDLLECQPWCPREGPLIIVAPHPDDETLGAGGLITTWARRQLPITLLSITDGEAACPEMADLATLRQRELSAALQVLSPGAAVVERLGLPDGRVGEHQVALAEALRAMTSSDVTIVAPFHQDGHPDHDIAGAVAQRVARQRGVTLVQYPIWAWHQATPLAFSGRRIGRFVLSQSAREAKAKAIRCHASQLRDRPGGPILPGHVVAYFDRPDEVFLL